MDYILIPRNSSKFFFSLVCTQHTLCQLLTSQPLPYLGPLALLVTTLWNRAPFQYCFGSAQVDTQRLVTRHTAATPRPPSPGSLCVACLFPTHVSFRSSSAAAPCLPLPAADACSGAHKSILLPAAAEAAAIFSMPPLAVHLALRYVLHRRVSFVLLRRGSTLRGGHRMGPHRSKYQLTDSVS